MREEIARVMKMVADGAATYEQGMALLDAMGAFEVVEIKPVSLSLPSPGDNKLLHIEMDTRMGDELNLNIPVSALDKGLDLSAMIERQALGEEWLAQVRQSILLARELIQVGMTGELVRIESRFGDELTITLN